jgi:acetoin utilization protein AcuB
MFVKDWMVKDVITIDENDTILDAVHLMKEHKIRRLPVLKKGKLTGIITEKDIKAFSPSKASSLDIYEMHSVLAKATVKDAMTTDVTTVHPDNPIERAALILRDGRFGGLPVVDDKGNLVGIISAVDVFEVFVEAMGMRTPGSRICIELGDRPGAIADMTSIIKAEGINIVSLATFYPKENKSIRTVVYRVSSDNQDSIDRAIENLKKAGYNITSVLGSDELIVVKE